METQVKNCWEYMNCGREEGGLMAERLGECPVSKSMRYDGTNGGRGAGRACWMVPDSRTHCSHNRLSETTSCKDCQFYKRVLFEQEEQTTHRFSNPKVVSGRSLALRRRTGERKINTNILR